MKPERWEQVGELYHAAGELEPAQRAAFLNQACAGDEELRREIESLLAADESAGEFIVAPALKDAAKVLVAEHPTSLALSASLAAGQELGPYRIISLLGKGGMGEVYLAHDSRLDRRVALKLLLATFTRDRARVRRFVREARAASALNHPNIVTIHELGEAGERRYIATEFIAGQTLRQLMAVGPLPPAAALDIAAQMAGALAVAHDAGIVHRDVKPENVMVRPDGLVKVLDFGLAKLTEGAAAAPNSTLETRAGVSGFKTEPGAILGTVAYMSPEQLPGSEPDGPSGPNSVDARSDLFSLGIVWYEMLAGRRPFEGATFSHLAVAIMDHDPPPISQFAPGIPPECDRIARKALAKDRLSRYQSAQELLADLKTLRPQLKSQADPIIPQTGPRITADPAPVTTGQAEPLPTHTGAALRTNTGLERTLARDKRSRNVIVIATSAVLLALAALLLYARRAPALTEKDTVLLADFVNQTDEEIFDSTLRQALAVQLEQTPFLNFLPEERTRETLRYMGRAPNERVTKDLAREICQRQGVKALLVGSIARFERRYAITLEAINSQTGETIASALAEAEGKDHVLRTLGGAATELRKRLGESLASIRKFDAPLEQATTASLEALKAWSRGAENVRSGRGEAMPLYKHAVELDPNFAKAHVSLSLAYGYQEQAEPAAEYAARAFALKDRVTERERFDIASNYYVAAQGDLLKAIEALELWRQTYPRDQSPRSRLASFYRLAGQFEKSLAAAREAHQINPKAYVPYVSMGTVLIQLGRFDEAQSVIEQAIHQQLATPTSRRDLYQIAAIKEDAAMMQQQVDWAAGKPEEYWALYWQAQSASFAGRLRLAAEFYTRTAALIEPRDPDRAASFAEEARLRGAVCGLCRPVKAAGDLRLRSARISQQSYIPAQVSRALSLALCGEPGAAQSLANEVGKGNPQSTLANFIWLPIVRAAIELQRGNPDLTIQALQAAVAYEPAALFWSNYLRGQAYLRLSKGPEAAAEFQRILDHRGWDALSPLYALAHLGKARAKALAGDGANCRKAYQDFLTSWKEADRNLPILQTAERECEKLK